MLGEAEQFFGGSEERIPDMMNRIYMMNIGEGNWGTVPLFGIFYRPGLVEAGFKH
jgi:hypothetical protein